MVLQSARIACFRENSMLFPSAGGSKQTPIPRSSVRFRLKPDNSNSHEFELHRPSNKGTKLLLKVIKAIIIIIIGSPIYVSAHSILSLANSSLHG